MTPEEDAAYVLRLEGALQFQDALVRLLLGARDDLVKAIEQAARGERTP